MVKNERFITFPAPEWNLPYVKNNNDDFFCYCVCYQYDFDDLGYGPYGLTTNSAANLVDDFFKDGLLTYSESHKNKLALHKFSSRKGLYLFSRKKKVTDLYNECTLYASNLVKSEILKKRGAKIESTPTKPLVLSYLQKVERSVEDITEIMHQGYGVMIVNYYTPQAGETLMFFDKVIFDAFVTEIINRGIGLAHFDSIDELKAW